MSEEKFTPGEWRAVVNEPLEDDFICDVYDQHNNCICECFSRGCWGDLKGITEAQKEANMHLIAAAPEMYRVLKRLIELTDYAELVGLLHDAKYILKKARGEE